MKKVFIGSVCAVVSLAWFLSTAAAIPPFQKEFLNKYVANSSNQAFVAAVKEAKCNVCHEGTKKTDRNAYGAVLSDRLDKKADAKNVAKIQQALDEVAAIPANGQNGGKTFGDLIKEGKLPSGNGN